MLLRHDDRGSLAIGQQSHAWISGQLARAWGNERFGAVEPFEEVCLAAEQHDVGMSAWDLSAPLNPRTGLPQTFLEMPLASHMVLWRLGPRRVETQSRYAALLISMHGSGCTSAATWTGCPRAMPTPSAPSCASSASTSKACSARSGPIRRPQPRLPRKRSRATSDLISTWDSLSLAMCLDWAPHTIEAVPAADGPASLHLTPERTLEPWPFASAHVAVHCEGKRLTERFDSDEALQSALASAPTETVRFELRSA